MHLVTRRDFFRTIPAAALVPAFDARSSRQEAAGPNAIPASFPRQDPGLAREIVGASHGNLARVRELVTARPALARASWEWGYGDWETALGAASHVGHKEIAAVLLAAGAHMTVFCAAMLGHLEAVKAFVAAAPGIQRTRGPHGITLLDHARAGKSDAVISYLESLGDADPAYPSAPLLDGDPENLLGTYTFGTAADEKMIVGRNTRGALVVKREGEPDRNLFHHGARTFNPAGAEAVRIRFEPGGGRATTLLVDDGAVHLRAAR